MFHRRQADLSIIGRSTITVDGRQVNQLRGVSIDPRINPKNFPNSARERQTLSVVIVQGISGLETRKILETARRLKLKQPTPILSAFFAEQYPEEITPGFTFLNETDPRFGTTTVVIGRGASRKLLYHNHDSHAIWTPNNRFAFIENASSK